MVGKWPSIFYISPGWYVGAVVVIKHHESGLPFLTGDTKS